MTFSFTPLHSVIGQFLVWLPYFPIIYRKPLSFLYLQQSTSVSIRRIFKTFFWSQLLCTKSAFIPQRGGMQISLSLYFADSFRAAKACSSDARLYQILCMRELGEEWFFLFLEGLEVRDCNFNHKWMCLEEDSNSVFTSG